VHETGISQGHSHETGFNWFFVLAVILNFDRGSPVVSSKVVKKQRKSGDFGQNEPEPTFYNYSNLFYFLDKRETKYHLN